MCRLIRSERILILTLSVCFVVVLEVVFAPRLSSAERSATFDAAQSFDGRRRMEPRRGGGGGRSGGPEYERRMKYREAGELLIQLDDELRKLELLTRDDVPGMVARRWEIATGILRDMSENTEEFVEALWLESIDLEEFLVPVDPLPLAPHIGVATLRGAIDQLRSMWRRWRDDKDVVDVERYEKLQGEAADLLVTIYMLLSTSTEDLPTLLSAVPRNAAREASFPGVGVAVADTDRITNAKTSYSTRNDESVDFGESLRTAARSGSIRDVEWLLGEGAHVNATDDEGWSPLMLAVREGHALTASRLLSAGADANARSRGGAYPLMWAIEADRSQLACDLMDVGADTTLLEDAISGDIRWDTVKARLPGIVAECHAAAPNLNRPTAKKPDRVPEVIDRRPDRPYTKIGSIQYVGDAVQAAPVGFEDTTGPMPPDVRRKILMGVIVPDAIDLDADTIVILEARAIYKIQPTSTGSGGTKLGVYPPADSDLDGRIVHIKYVVLAEAITFGPEN